LIYCDGLIIIIKNQLEKRMIAYKVLTKRLESVWVMDSYIYHKGIINKRIDGWGPFACFDTFENARKFADTVRLIEKVQ
jgi:hypothetical protein